MLVSPSSDQVASEALSSAEPQGRATCAERAVAIAYGSAVSVAMLGWLYALGLGLRSGLSWMFS
jgi:hypothetical protein